MPERVGACLDSATGGYICIFAKHTEQPAKPGSKLRGQGQFDRDFLAASVL